MTPPQADPRDEFAWVWCDECGQQVPVVEDWDDQIGFEEQAREVHVYRLDCGHEVVTDAR